MKKWLGLFLSIVMTFTTVFTSFASVDSQTKKLVSTYEGRIENGYMYTMVTDYKSVTILTNDEENLIDIAITYSSDPGKVYQLLIDDYPEMELSPRTSEFWSGVIRYAESNLSNAKINIIRQVRYEEPIEVSTMRSLLGGYFKSEYRSNEESEYSDRLKYTTTYEGQTIRIYESFDDIIVDELGFDSWSTAISVSSLIATIIGAKATTKRVQDICNLYGVSVGFASLVPAGSINYYSITGDVYRYSTVNGSEYAYTITDKFIEYMGYENPDINNEDPAVFDSESREVYYSDSQSYFNSYVSQKEDAYEMFTRIGQMD